MRPPFADETPHFHRGRPLRLPFRRVREEDVPCPHRDNDARIQKKHAPAKFTPLTGDSAGAFESVPEEHSYRHRPDSARHRRNRARDSGAALEVGVAHETETLRLRRVGNPVYADVYYYRARFEHVAGKRVRPPARA